eukprot:GDKH01016474.1.p1 GENE.GDKH01016474.1~~GDKH01016474.1.p1  ORF type:complete len:91 (+),score=1.77 GDKH01016474.1:324-596(+)
MLGYVAPNRLPPHGAPRRSSEVRHNGFSNSVDVQHSGRRPRPQGCRSPKKELTQTQKRTTAKDFRAEHGGWHAAAALDGCDWSSAGHCSG